MAILIENMEMPTEGYIDVRINCNGTASFAIAKYPYFKEVEAVPVPTHGRLIDADALINDYPRTWSTYALQRIENAPTIIPASEETE